MLEVQRIICGRYGVSVSVLQVRKLKLREVTGPRKHSLCAFINFDDVYVKFKKGINVFGEILREGANIFEW